MLQVKNIADDFYVNVNLSTEMDLPRGRDGVMHYFEQLQKRYPEMTNFYARGNGDFVLEAEKDKGYYRWASVEQRRICSGYVNPTDYQDALQQHEYVLEQLPYALSVSPLECESLNFTFGFDFTYRGNHNDLVAEALGTPSGFEPLIEMPGVKLVGFDPSIQFALDEDCRTQCRITVESRTNTFNIRTGEFPEEQLSVYMTLRRFGSLEPGTSYIDNIRTLRGHAERIAQDYLIDNVLVPLQQAIAIK